MDEASPLRRALVFIRQLQAMVRWGNGAPTDVVRAPMGAIYLNFEGGTSTTLWVKQSETDPGDATGWVAK